MSNPRARIYETGRSDAVQFGGKDAYVKLVAKSYAWGSPEWLEIRRAPLKQGGIKPMTSRFQRWLYKTFKATGLE